MPIASAVGWEQVMDLGFTVSMRIVQDEGGGR